MQTETTRYNRTLADVTSRGYGITLNLNTDGANGAGVAAFTRPGQRFTLTTNATSVPESALIQGF